MYGSITYLQALSFLQDYEALVLEAQEPFEQLKQSARSRGTLKAILRCLQLDRERRRRCLLSKLSRLAELKLTHAAQIPWGELYGELSKDGQVIEFAWKDANVVLFMGIVDDGEFYTSTLRLKS